MKLNTTILLLTALGTLAGAVVERFAADRGEVREPWIEGIVSGDGLSNADVANLRRLGPAALPQLIEALGREDSVLRRVYIRLWPKLPAWLQDRLPQLLYVEQVRANAAATVGHLGVVACPAVPYLAALLRDDIADADAAISLGRIGLGARDAVPALIAAVRAERPFAATALGKIGDPTGAARQALEAASIEGPNWLRHESALALRRLEEGASTRPTRVPTATAAAAGTAEASPADRRN